MSHSNSTTEEDGDEMDFPDKLLAMVKKEVKHVMEEAVTRKFIHEDSSSVTSLCGAVDACLKYKLRRQTLSLFTSRDSSHALLNKISKQCSEADQVTKLLSAHEHENDHTSRISLRSLTMESKKPVRNGLHKHTWIRIALFNKHICSIITHLVQQHRRYYEDGSLLSDQSKGTLLSQLLEGPSALEYSKMRTCDHLYTDPHADELVLRQRLHSTTSNPLPSNGNLPHKRLALSATDSVGYVEDKNRSGPVHAREYVRSLHQNSTCILLYGKNNVRLQPRGSNEIQPGYLSLHQTDYNLLLKWTPNRLINNNNSADSDCEVIMEEPTEKAAIITPRSARRSSSINPEAKRFLPSKTLLYWDCAINVDLDDVVYIHCHHQGSCGGTLILVDIEGAQSPPFSFPYGGHLLAFLTCLESGLLPNAKLDPPLWIHKDTGKIFPAIKRRFSVQLSVDGERSLEDLSLPSGSLASELYSSTDNDVDYVFRILRSHRPQHDVHDIIDPSNFNLNTLITFNKFKLPTFPWLSKSQPSTESAQPTSVEEQPAEPQKPPLQTRDSLQKLCDTMKQKLLARAFNGWLAHCRHLKTVREHLSGLVYSGEVILPVPPVNEKSLTAEFWNSLNDRQKLVRNFEVYRRIYYGGVSHEIRKHVWPYLLGHYAFGQSESERSSRDKLASSIYETTLTQWTLLEETLKSRRDAKSQSTNQSNHHYMRQDSQLSNDNKLQHSKVFLESSNSCDNDSTGNQPIKSKASLTKWHTIDTAYPEDYCSVKVDNLHPLSNSTGSMLDWDQQQPKITKHVLDELDINLHRIDKDVHRCDRTYWYFTENNLKKLRNVMVTYVFRNLEVGYIQGMCDLVAPLLVIFDDEVMTHSCFSELMKRMVENFPTGRAMDCHLANMRSLLKVLDPELFDLMQQNGDYTHLFFCYRWLLLDFKREMCYDDIFLIWESIWAAKNVCSDNYVVFIGLAMIQVYRDILLDNVMDFIDVMKFFNEMAEKHEASEVLSVARKLVFQLQNLIDNK